MVMPYHFLLEFYHFILVIMIGTYEEQLLQTQSKIQALEEIILEKSEKLSNS